MMDLYALNIVSIKRMQVTSSLRQLRPLITNNCMTVQALRLCTLYVSAIGLREK
jgi:hypothetical protein